MQILLELRGEGKMAVKKTETKNTTAKAPAKKPAAKKTAPKSKPLDIVDYVVTHREYDIPEDEMYKVLCVGKYRKDGALHEHDGDNITRYNERINELTGLYWIWKNTDSEYVGMSHYRRYFDEDGHRISKAKAEELLKDHDIILSDKYQLGHTVHNNIVGIEGYDWDAKAYKAFMDAIRKNQPEYEDAFVQAFDSTEFHVCNLFITSRKILNEYCEWLFSIILEAADSVDVGNCDYYHRRICGYYGEVMWSVWLRKQKYKVAEVPILRLEGR